MSVKHSPTTEIHAEAISIRRLGDEDLAAVERLAQLESRRPPEGTLLGVEIEGRLLAAISLATGESIADPFSRSAELRALLELRAAQLRRRENGRRRLPRYLPKPKTRAALAVGPPDTARWWLIAQRWRPS
ncbi:MAG: hypothetical protein E6G48_03655 [Actinobacteria bacterium]|nr:MAG: hypothetical protein E6G48_03655 [Actinomycetota bacterium]